MDILGTIAAAVISLAPVSDKLDGTWIETEQFKDHPRAVLHFKGRNLRFENMFGTSDTVEYKVMEKKADNFRIMFEYRYELKKPSGRIVEHDVAPEYLYHEENGRPILSEIGFEYDGRGSIVMSEYLRKEDFIDGFRSELLHKLNDRSAPPMMKKQP